MPSVWPLLPVATVTAVVLLARYCGPLLRLYAQEPVPIGIPVITCILILITPQMSDMLAAIVGGRGRSTYDEAWWHPIGFGIGTLMLGFNAWFWMRAALNARAGWRNEDMPEEVPWHQLFAARLVLVPILLIAASPLVAVAQRRMSLGDVPWLGVLAAAVACGIVLAFAWWRRRRNLASHRSAHARRRNSPLPALRWKRLFAAAPFGPAVAYASLALALAGFVLAQAWPRGIDEYLHSAWAALLAMACLIPVATVLVALARDAIETAILWLEGWMSRRFGRLLTGPAARARAADLGGLALLLVLPLLGSWEAEQAGWYDIETTENGSPARPSIAEAAAAFAACHKDEARPVPAIIVAIEGGASRSGAWGMSALRMLDAATQNRFGAHVFALSSVSGGSLAAVTYAMTRAGAPAGTPIFNLDSTQNGMIELARADLIPAVMFRMLTADMLLGIPTRGWALSRSFERNWEWNEGFGLKGTRREGIQAVQASAPCQPHLLLNGTDVRTGSRVLTSTLAVEEPRLGRAEIFPDAIDAIGELGADVTVSAAVLNSARFPLISPPGRLRRQAAGAEASMVVDGGVFEGYGARTAHELATALRSDGVQPIVVMIRNDGEYAAAYPNGPCEPPKTDTRILQEQAAAKQAAAERGVYVPEFLTSLLGLNAARGAHGRAELFALQRDFCADGSLFDFDMPAVSGQGDTGVPMNWVLDGRNCQVLLGRARISTRNIAQATALAARLGIKEYEDHDGARQMADLIKGLPDAARCRPSREPNSVLAKSG